MDGVAWNIVKKSNANAALGVYRLKVILEENVAN